MTTVRTMTAPGAADPLIGRRVGGYSVASLLGEGGMGKVEGADLGDHVEHVGAQQGHPGRISFESALPLLLQVCAAQRDHRDQRDGRSNDHDPADVVTGASS